MKKNMGIADKFIRVIIAVVILTLYFTNVISGILGIVLIVLSGVFILTSLISFCPLYTIFGISSNRAKQK
jgi:hypothetical protein